MNTEFLTFRKFDDPALASELADDLTKHQIAYEVEQASKVGNPLLASGGEGLIEYSVKIAPADFDRVNELLVADEARAVDDVERDYYLFDFTDDELKDVLKNYDEWGAFDIALARKILGERGVVINEHEITAFKEHKLEELSKPESPQTIWVVIGYMCALLGGILGIFIGWMMWRFEKTLPNGDRVYAYTDGDRRQGKRIFIVGIVVFVLAAIQKIYGLYRW